MKIAIVIAAILATGLSDATDEKDLQKISAAVHAFAESADKQDIPKMDEVLHAEFRAVVNRLFGSEEVAVMPKTAYLDLLKAGKIGGDSRTVQIQSIDLEGNNAMVRAVFTGKELVFTTYLQLVKEAAGNWKIISDMPTIEKINS